MMTTIALPPRESSGDHPVSSSEEEEESVTLHVDDSDSDNESDEENNRDDDDQASISMTLVTRQRISHVVSEYELSVSTDPAELQGFQRLADRLATQCQSFVIYAGVHLFDAGGHLTLGAHVSSTDVSLPPLAERRLVPASQSLCHSVVSRNDTGSLISLKEITEGSVFYERVGREALYASCLLRNKNSVGVGTVCVVLNSKDAMNDQVEFALTDASQDAMHQLELRRLLTAKNRAAIQNLQEQNRILHRQLHSSHHGHPSKQTASSVVLPSFGVVSAVTTEDLMRHDQSRHWPRDATSTTTSAESDASTQPPRKPVRSAMLPMFHNENSANEQERSHLPDDYYAIVDALNVDRTPVHKNDQQRVATLESLEMHLIQPDEPTGVALKRVTDMAARLFECDYAEVSFLNHSKGYNIASHFSCSLEAKAKVCQFKPPLSVRPDNGDPWLCEMDRGIAFCNYVMYTKSTFTLPDVSADETFAWAEDLKFYSASPIVIRGEVVAALCVVDLRRAHPEFTAAHQIQQEQLAQLAAQHIENWVVQRELQRRPFLVHPEMPLDDSSTGKSIPPEYLAAVVFTGIQGSAALRDANALAMQEAVVLHNDIIRDCIAENHGYEIKNEGDSFQIVFHDCDDAVSFALHAQERLYEAPWGDEILGLPDGCTSASKALRGLRVRIGLHYGPVTYQTNDVTGRHEYSGTTVNIAKSLAHMTYGGQITATVDVWESFHATSTKLQVLDLGRHILLKGTHSQDGVIEKAVVQLVPLSLAFDYVASRTLKGDASSVDQKALTSGRQFPPLLSLQRLSASFHEAPYVRNMVTILCLSTVEVETFCMDPDIVLAALAKQIGTLLRDAVTHGYQCQDFVLAFATLSDAVSFGLTVQDHLRTSRVAGVHLAHLLSIGIHTGKFVSMGPHSTTGRADYKGTVVHTAARVAEAARSGQVVVGMMDDEIPALAPELDSTYIGNRALTDIPGEMDLHVCQWESESPQDE